MRRLQKREFILLVITICLFVTIYFLYTYKSVDDFAYLRVPEVVSLINSHFISISNTNPGFIILSAIIILVSNIPTFFLPLMPLQAIPLLMLFISTNRKIGNYNLFSYLSIMTYIVTLTNPNPISWFVHGMGFILVLTLFYVILLNSESSKPELSVLIILVLISLNFMSYKMIAYAMLFIFALLVVEFLERQRSNIESWQGNKSILNILAIGCVITLSFNYFFYNTFLPIMKDPSQFSTSNGIEKVLLARFSNLSLDPFSAYLYRPLLPIIFTVFSLIRWPLYLGIMYFLIRILFTESKKNNTRPIARIVVALFLSSIIMTVIYIILGTFDTYVFGISMLFGLSLLLSFKKYKRFAVITLVYMLVLNISMFSYMLGNNIFPIQKDNTNFKYLQSLSSWYINNENFQGVKNNFVVPATDVLTWSIILTDLTNHNIPSAYAPSVFSKQQMKFLLGMERINASNKHEQYIVNYKENHFSMLGWDVFNSWNQIGNKLKDNASLNSIYSSGHVVIYKM